MKNPLHDLDITSKGLNALGNSPETIFDHYIYFIESCAMPIICNLNRSNNMQNSSTYGNTHDNIAAPIHDLLLELTMTLFDCMNDDKQILHRLSVDASGHPFLLKKIRDSFHKCAIRLFDAINLPIHNPHDSIRLHIYSICFGRWIKIWLNDDTIDQSRTLSTVDQDLRQLKEWKDYLKI